MESKIFFRFKDRIIELNNKVLIMGVLNVTPDSFSENGLNFIPDIAVKSALKMICEGADIIDVGGESTRPGADPINASEEISRILPVICALRSQSGIPISIDTSKSDVAKIALENGADIINDISGFRLDAAMKMVARDFNAGCIIMHMRGTPKTMQNYVDYEDIIDEIAQFFRHSMDRLSDTGIEEDFMCLDPGIGFSKTVEQNLFLIKNLSQFKKLGRPLLLGPSRKSFIGKTLRIDTPQNRIWGTAATICYSISQGVNIVRVHDVKEIHQLCTMTKAILSSSQP